MSAAPDTTVNLRMTSVVLATVETTGKAFRITGGRINAY